MPRIAGSISPDKAQIVFLRAPISRSAYGLFLPPAGKTLIQTSPTLIPFWAGANTLARPIPEVALVTTAHWVTRAVTIVSPPQLSTIVTSPGQPF